MSNNNDAVDDDFFNIILFVAIAGMALMGAFLLYVPLLYLTGLYILPVYMGGFLGAMGVALPFIVFLAYKFFKQQKMPWNYPLAICLAVVYPTLAIVMHKEFVAPIAVLCQSPEPTLMWIKNCPKPSALMLMGLKLPLFFLVPLMPLIFWLFSYILRVFMTESDPHTVYRRSLNFEQYLRMQSQIYPHLKFYSKVNPLKFELFVTELRLLDNAKRFAFGKFLISHFVERGKNEVEEQTDNPAQGDEADVYLNPLNTVPVIDPYKFDQEMLLQLGNLWTDVDDLNDLEVIVFSCVVPRLTALDPQMDDKTANETLKLMYDFIDKQWEIVSRCIDENGNVIKEFDPQEVAKRRKVLKEASQHEIFQGILKKHAYTRTVLFECFVQVRTLGVIQASEFSWVFFFDRELWACINNIGRPSFFCEGLAVANHYLLEKINGTALYGTDFSSARKGLENALAPYHFSPEVISAYETWQTKGDIRPLMKTNVFTQNDQTITTIFLAESQRVNQYLQEHDNLPTVNPVIDTGSKELDEKIRAEQHESNTETGEPTPA